MKTELSVGFDIILIRTSAPNKIPKVEAKIRKIQLVAKQLRNPKLHTKVGKMGKDKSEKKEKKEKRSEKDGVKKPKKEKKSKLSPENLTAAFDEATKEVEKPVIETKALIVKDSSGEIVIKPVGALVPFANPLADEKITKKVLKSVKKGTDSAQCHIQIR